jgi:hypothetical protein
MGKVANVGGVSVVTSPNILKKPGSNIQYYSDPNRVYSSDPLIASGQRPGKLKEKPYMVNLKNRLVRRLLT